jgi:hypothetical protein
MKKLLLLSVFAASMGMSVQAQTRLSLYEEFTGENCPPCASTNPRFWALCLTGTNPSKMLQISYMVDIPSGGPFYAQNSVAVDARMSYYSVRSAPNGYIDGSISSPSSSSPGHPINFTQTELDAAQAVSAKFNMTVSSAWNSTYDSIISTVTITGATTYSASSLKLRAALIQNVDWATPPGSNGETHFKDVVRAMYPDASGTTITTTSWTTSTTQTYRIAGKVPSYVDKSDSAYMVVWIQNESTKKVEQAARSSFLPRMTNDAGSIKTNAPSGLVCATGAYSLSHSVVLTNAGSSTLTSAKVYYNVNGGAWSTYNWTGSLATSASTTVTLPAITVPRFPGAGFQVVKDSVDAPNGSTDYNMGNGVTTGFFFLQSDSGRAMPFAQTFETLPQDMYFINPNNNTISWFVVWSGSTSAPLGYAGSTWAVYHNNYDATAGEQNIVTLPTINTTSPSAIDFYVAYKKRNLTSTDALDLVYSTNCGSSWTSIWSKSGSSLAAGNTDTTNFRYVPSASTTGAYRLQSASLDAVPRGAMLGFRATAGGGNYLFIDNINVRAGVATSVNAVTSEAQILLTLAPNPATNESKLSFNLTAPSDISVEVVDVTGRAYVVSTQKEVAAGSQTVTINTSALAAGIYNVVLHTNGGTFSERMAVIK